MNESYFFLSSAFKFRKKNKKSLKHLNYEIDFWNL